ncbi:MAG: universal stress protein [Bacteroidales bacterium]|nr:universal stress protein [Bacteroidales bacterium]
MKNELKNILVPVDFEPASTIAAKYAVNLAKRLNSNIILLYVVEMPGLFYDIFSSGSEIEKIIQNADNKLNNLVNEIKKDGIEIKYRVEKGKPYERILEVSDEENARMIVLGENHSGNEAENNLGTTVFHVTLKASVPVLTIKGDKKEMGCKILVPLDLTKRTGKQVYSAIVYGLNYKAEIYLVSSVVGGVKIKESRIYRRLKRIKNLIEENGIKCYVKLYKRSEISPYKRVLEYINEIDPDMVLLMTHQEGFQHDNYIGAFAHHIINESPVPVLSLTSSASNFNYSEVFKNIIDPIGILKK